MVQNTNGIYKKIPTENDVDDINKTSGLFVVKRGHDSGYYQGEQSLTDTTQEGYIVLWL